MASKYKYNQNAGALQEAMPAQERARSEVEAEPYPSRAAASMAAPPPPEPPRRSAPLVQPAGRAGVDRTQRLAGERADVLRLGQITHSRGLALHADGLDLLEDLVFAMLVGIRVGSGSAFGGASVDVPRLNPFHRTLLRLARAPRCRSA